VLGLKCKLSGEAVRRITDLASGLIITPSDQEKSVGDFVLA
jgi:hypothetical protein